MKFTLGQIDDAFAGLTVLNNEESIKLTSEACIKVAINSNLLKPIVQGHNIARFKYIAELNKKNRGLGDSEKRTNAELEADLAVWEETERAKEHDIDVRTFLKADLRLADNPKINGGVIAKLWPILEGMDVS